MMKINSSDGKKFFFVLGLQSAGTTLVCNIFNSAENAFCLSEPHWTLQTQPKRLRFDKIPSIRYKSVGTIVPQTKEWLESSGYLFGGIKETYKPKSMTPYDKIINKADFFIIILRNPIYNFNSLKRDGMTIGTFLENYNSLLSLGRDRKAIFFSLEKICAHGDKRILKYLNNKLNGICSIGGEFALKPTNYVYGNVHANASRNIKGADFSVRYLDQHEIKLISTELLPLYKSMI